MDGNILELCRSVVPDTDWKIAVVRSGQQPEFYAVFVERYDKEEPRGLLDRILINVHGPTWERWSETERRSFLESQWLELREFGSTDKQREMMTMAGGGNNNQGAA